MRQGRTQLKVNDKVEVIAGKDKGRVGKILQIDKTKQRVVVERINMIKRHQKSRDPNQPGQIVEQKLQLIFPTSCWSAQSVLRLFV